MQNPVHLVQKYIFLPNAFGPGSWRPVLGVGSSSSPPTSNITSSFPSLNVVSDRVPYLCIHEAVEQRYRETL